MCRGGSGVRGPPPLLWSLSEDGQLVTREQALGRVPIPRASDGPFLPSLLAGKSSIIKCVWRVDAQRMERKGGKETSLSLFFGFRTLFVLQGLPPLFLLP